MRRLGMLLAFGGILLVGASTARAQATLTASGTIDWSALTRFDVQSAEVVFLNPYTGDRIVAPLTGLEDRHASYSVTLNGATPYFVSAVVADCTGDPEVCGSATASGTHIRFGGLFTFTPEDGSPLEFSFTADQSLNPVVINGTVTVNGGTFLNMLASATAGGPESPLSLGVFSTALVAPPLTSFSVLAAEFSFVVIQSTVTISQTQVPTCPAQIDVPHVDFGFIGQDPLTDTIVITVPPGPPGELTGSFAVTGFPTQDTSAFGFNLGPTIGACAGLTTFNLFSGPTLSFDIPQALAGQWLVGASAFTRANSADGYFEISRIAQPMQGDTFFRPNVTAAGSPIVVPLSYTPGFVNGNVEADARRWGGPFAWFNHLPILQGITPTVGAMGAQWNPNAINLVPMRVAEQYELALDPRATTWVMTIASGVGFGYQFPAANGSSSSGYAGVGALPNVGSNTPAYDQFNNLSVVIGSVTGGSHPTINLPKLDFHTATVRLNPLPGASSIIWSAGQGRYPLANGVLGTPSGQLAAFSFDASAPVGQGTFPPGRYDGRATSLDANFNAIDDARSFDLEPDDDVTSDFGAPALLAVRPIPGAAGGSATVSGKIVSSDPAVTSLQVTVDGAAATVLSDGSFSIGGRTIGTGPLTVVGRDNLGRTTTLKRYFTTITGLIAPATGADLVSQNQDVYGLTNFVFAPPVASPPLHSPQTVPLRLTGALGSVAVSSANASAPHIVGLVKVAQFQAPVPITPTGNTVFQFTGGTWLCNLNTAGLQPGTYVVQIQFWDGRILEAAFQIV